MKDVFVGDETLGTLGKVLDINYVAQNSVIEDWEDMERILNHVFYNELRVAPEELAGIMVTEPPGNPQSNAEKMATLLFETF